MEKSVKKLAFRMLTYNGETHSISEWSRRTGIPDSTLNGRVLKEWTPGQALGFEPPPPNRTVKFKPSQFITYNGETHSRSEWARKRDIQRATLDARLRKGWTDGQALGFEPPPTPLSRPKAESFDLREWRKKRGWTAAETGEYLGLTPSAVLMNERGNQPMSDTTKRLIDCIDRFGPLRPAALPKSIRTWRLKHGWSQEQAAEKLGVHPITVWKLEKYDEKSWRREGQLRRLMAYIDMEEASQKPPE